MKKMWKQMIDNPCSKIPCRDCTNTHCYLHGDVSADCPKYKCDRPDEYKYACDKCEFIDRYIKDVYYNKGE